MKQKNRYIATLIILLLGLSGCATDEEKVSSKGTISIGVNLDTSVKTKAGENSQGPIKLTIVKSDKDGKPVPESPVYEYDLTTDGSREISLNADTYLLTAIVGNDPKGRPASEPYYVGTKIVDLTAGKTEKVTMDCKLTTAVIVVDYSGLYAYDAVGDYETIVVDSIENTALNITFCKGRDTKGYFVAGKTLSVTFRYEINGVWTEKKMPQITTLEEQHQYTIKYFINEGGPAEGTGSAGIGIEIKNPSEKDVQIDITIPLDLSVRIFPDETSAEIIGSVKTNTELKNASFEYKAKDDTEWTLVPLDSDLKAKISELKSGQLYNYKFTCAGNEKTGDFVTTPKISAWTSFAVPISENEDDIAGFSLMYKQAGASSWIKNNGLKLTGLIPGGSYEYMFVSPDGMERKPEGTFVTEVCKSLENGDFNVWNEYVTGKGTIFNPYKKTWFVGSKEEADAHDAFWDSGNMGTSQGLAAALGGVNPTSPVSDEKGGKAAYLYSQYVGINSSLGQFAAGNLYTGQFQGLVGMTGAKICFGRPFTSRPVKLIGRYKYKPATINYGGHEELAIGNEDKCAIYVALTDEEGLGKTAREVNTSTGSFIDYDVDPNIVAYGSISDDEAKGTPGWSEEAGIGWVNFSINIEYRSLTRTPKYIIVVASASKYGDYFTGGTSSAMYLDDFELIYGDNPVTQ